MKNQTEFGILTPKSPENCKCLNTKNMVLKRPQTAFTCRTCKILPSTGFLQSPQQEFPDYTQM